MYNSSVSPFPLAVCFVVDAARVVHDMSRYRTISFCKVLYIIVLKLMLKLDASLVLCDFDPLPLSLPCQLSQMCKAYYWILSCRVLLPFCDIIL